MAFKELLSKNLPQRRSSEANPILRLQENMNRMFNNFFDSADLAPFKEDGLGSFPKIDIKETSKAVMITAELPGLDAKDIDISISDDVLTLRGEKNMESESKEENYYRMERSYGSFHRTIPLPMEVESENVNAEFKNGVLKVTVTKKPEAQRKAKKIEINSA
jgi:HSP20 family protein